MISKRWYDTCTIPECKRHYFFIFLYSASFLSLQVLIPLEGWKQSPFHTLFPGIAAKFQGTKCEGIGCEYWCVFGGSSWLAMSLFQPSTYWNKIAIYPFDSWSSTCPWRIKDKKMSRCPEGAFHSDSFLCHFWGSLWAQASLAALWQAGTWEGLWGTA